ncbi:hypothetical protein C5167_035121 [Papaver somniferum]|uniref:Phosphotransferase n=1 Tax=Papaver somniferum TaxID=3469 RepID=A0A4Y7KIR0_PAPSO|nr:hypothetical protein C5167_035121 [Papaver somniferum]
MNGNEVDKLTEKLQGVGIASASADGVVNDTVGTLALGHFHDGDTLAAVTIGTGTNAWYVERTDPIIKTQGLLTNSGGMALTFPTSLTKDSANI